MKNKILPILILTSSFIFAQGTQESSSQIILPELSTTVSGDAVTAEKNSLPDFETLLPLPKQDSDTLPDFAELVVQDFVPEPAANFSGDIEKTIYANGLVGGGFSGYFIGDFSIYKSSGANPFLLQFSHITENGYGKKQASEGYYDSETNLLGEKTLKLKSWEFFFNANYNTSSYGLQNKLPAFYDLNFQTFGTKDSVKWNLPKNLFLAFDLDGFYYSRYAGIRDKNEADTFVEQEKNAKFLQAQGIFKFGWANENFSAGLDFAYNGRTFLSDAEYVYEAPVGYVGFDYEKENYFTAINYGLLKANFSWRNSIYKVTAEIGALFDKEDGSIENVKNVLAPFNIGFGGQWKIGKAERILALAVSGGLDAYYTAVSELEKSSWYALAVSVPGLSSDWLVNASLLIPIAQKFTLDTKAEFRATAFGNGVWEADYDDDEKYASGLYSFAQDNRVILKIDSTFSYIWKIFTVSAGIKTNIFHISPIEYPFTAIGLISYESPKNVWGFSSQVSVPFGNGAGFIPVIDGSIWYKPWSSIKISFEIEDCIKLCTLSNRSYMDSDFDRRSGALTLLAKFSF